LFTFLLLTFWYASVPNLAIPYSFILNWQIKHLYTGILIMGHYLLSARTAANQTSNYLSNTDYFIHINHRNFIFILVLVYVFLNYHVFFFFYLFQIICQENTFTLTVIFRFHYIKIIRILFDILSQFTNNRFEYLKF
jgi:hypothetical protein